MTTRHEDATDNSERQALAQLQGIERMLARLEHAQNCDGGDDTAADGVCELTDAEIAEGGDYFISSTYTIADARRDYHDEDKARESIEEDPLSVETRSGWHAPGEHDEADEEYCILLCTGGPAVRIIGELDEDGEPTSARLQHQDWGTPWTEYITTGVDHQALLEYAAHFLGGF